MLAARTHVNKLDTAALKKRRDLDPRRGRQGARNVGNDARAKGKLVGVSGLSRLFSNPTHRRLSGSSTLSSISERDPRKLAIGARQGRHR
jgi:hypothetical protein